RTIQYPPLFAIEHHGVLGSLRGDTGTVRAMYSCPDMLSGHDDTDASHHAPYSRQRRRHARRKRAPALPAESGARSGAGRTGTLVRRPQSDGSSADVARLTNLTAQTINPIVNRLEASGLITKTADPVHGRIIRLF